MSTETQPEPRTLTFAERSTYGRCPICHAEHDEPCVTTEAFPSVVRERASAHAARLRNAPRYIGEPA